MVRRRAVAVGRVAFSHWRARSAWGAARRAQGRGRPCGPPALRSSGRGAPSFGSSAMRTAHDAGESSRSALRAPPRPCGPRRVPRPPRPHPKPLCCRVRAPAVSLRPHPGLSASGEGAGVTLARACLQRCGQAGRGARGRRRACVLRGAAGPQCTLRELNRRRRAQRAHAREPSGRRAPAAHKPGKSARRAHRRPRASRPACPHLRRAIAGMPALRCTNAHRAEERQSHPSCSTVAKRDQQA